MKNKIPKKNNKLSISNNIIKLNKLSHDDFLKAITVGFIINTNKTDFNDEFEIEKGRS